VFYKNFECSFAASGRLPSYINLFFGKSIKISSKLCRDFIENYPASFTEKKVRLKSGASSDQTGRS
jgi:hypothetical protein